MRKLSQSPAAALFFSFSMLRPVFGLAHPVGHVLEQASDERTDRVLSASSSNKNTDDLPIAPRPESNVDESSNDQVAKPQLGAPKPESGDRGLVGLQVRISTLGAGAEVATSLTQKLNLRGGLNMFSCNRGFNHHGITYKGQLDLHPGEVHLDFYPFGHGLHLNPGLLVYNGNGATANANVPGNSTFSLGGTT